MIVRLAAAVFAAAALFHGATSLLWLYEQRRAGGCARRRAWEAWRTWLAELASLLVVVVTWPFGWLPGRSPGRGSGRPVLLLHGWSLNRASMAVLGARLRRDGRKAIAINYPSMSPDAESKAAFVAARIRELAAASGDAVDVVAHSLAGVVLRAAARDALDGFVGNVVTLGSPHRGSALALLSDRAGLADLRPGSTLLADLGEHDRLVDIANVTAVASAIDTIVFPPDLAYYQGALNVTIEGVGHHGLLYSGRVYEVVKENLDAPRRERRI